MVCWSAGCATRREEPALTLDLPYPALVRFDHMVRRLVRRAGSVAVSSLRPVGGGAETERPPAEVPAVWRHDDRGPAPD